MVPVPNMAPLLYLASAQKLGRGPWRRAVLTLTGCVDAVSGHRVFLHSLGAGGELRKAGHEGAQHQHEAQGCHLGTERAAVRSGVGAGSKAGHPQCFSPKPVFLQKQLPELTSPRCGGLLPSLEQVRLRRPPQAIAGCTTGSTRKRAGGNTVSSTKSGRSQERKKGQVEVGQAGLHGSFGGEGAICQQDELRQGPQLTTALRVSQAGVLSRAATGCTF